MFLWYNGFDSREGGGGAKHYIMLKNLIHYFCWEFTGNFSANPEYEQRLITLLFIYRGCLANMIEIQIL